MAEEQEFTVIKVTTATKERFEKARQKIPFEDAKTADDFQNYILDQLEKKK